MARQWHGGQVTGMFFWLHRRRRNLAEGGAESGEVAVERRVGTGLEGDVAFGVKDEAAHVGRACPHWPCHTRATSDGQTRYRADNHGQPHDPMSWPPLPLAA